MRISSRSTLRHCASNKCVQRRPSFAKPPQGMSVSARGVSGSPRLPPLDYNVVRAATARGSSNAAVRGGGRLFDQSPLDGYTEAEMIQEAKIRLQHNKQRMQLKKLLSSAAQKGELVTADDLMIACQLAKMPIDQEHLRQMGSPSAVPWKPIP